MGYPVLTLLRMHATVPVLYPWCSLVVSLLYPCRAPSPVFCSVWCLFLREFPCPLLYLLSSLVSLVFVPCIPCRRPMYLSLVPLPLHPLSNVALWRRSGCLSPLKKNGTRGPGYSQCTTDTDRVQAHSRRTADHHLRPPLQPTHNRHSPPSITFPIRLTLRRARRGPPPAMAMTRTRRSDIHCTP